MADKTNQKMLLVVNPVSGKKMAKQYMMRMINRFDQAGYNVTACCTQINKNAYDIVKNRGAEFDIIVCCGGDGTLKETVCGVMDLGKDIPVGYLPMGSTNDFAHSLNIPTDVFAAVEAIINGEPKPVDVGKFGDEYYIYVAGFGNFTAISYGVNQKIKNALGKNAYYVQAVKDFFKMKPYHARIEADGEFFEGDWFYGAASNSYSVGGLPVLHNIGVEFDDGLHELVLVRMFKNPMELLRLANDMVHKTVAKNDNVIIRHCKHIKFMFDDPTPFTLDGEFGGDHLEVEAEALKHTVHIMQKKPEWVSMEDSEEHIFTEETVKEEPVKEEPVAAE